ncbi:hippurate hydrolase [Cupriavidus metallidurans]|mgnify:FL=1|jgi:hippurate hydrolase|uniref:Peptidase, M20D subfamily n=1 Tax=Cupriavidus metallidurans (strain ATCC 43123 / DSM 2839 / NBRC 102507 / CH34) TaxID=266264 RepID=Q1LC48_CUPMC|nr:M20 aminoacylase family protein [Cupriavidus metallidurans]ABF12278.1 peptidase, M20D subfamily [Cupriavidus metallidurans CH34]AVA35613.1 amidohydrolase [Cupriavidus metallidurans]KWW35435.1 putative hydrolase YxeP [Cupriavidus metallidurans]MDE4921577.1 M20 family metallopeptidase [Cupriavidus metallidurans]QGS32474.1 amidohydrolase [Cupriavidus metallidurans]
MTTTPIPAAISSAASRFADLRHRIHAHPELGADVPRTAAMVAGLLREWGYDVHTGIGGHGIVAQLNVGNGPRRIGIRADMDALPLQERTGLPYASEVPGRMHACGHDGHTATLLAAAEYLAATRNFDGTLNLIFQPDEEGMTGALSMMEDGLFERFPCDAIYAFHNAPGLPVGMAVVQSGAQGGSSDRVTVTFRGKGGHGAIPNRAADPTLALAHTVVALQGIIARNVAPVDAGVISVGQIEAGTTYNIIPETATLKLSVRATLPEVRKLLEERIRAVVTHQAASAGVEAEIEYLHLVPAIRNTPAEAAIAREAVASVLGNDNVIQVPPSTQMGSEDFAWMLEKVPGCYFVLGNGTGEWVGCSVHNDGYDFNDALIPLGAACWVALAEGYLKS